MAETKATVDVITAEVRVLSVGSRQVTLSVYNQLDDVPHTAIQPFGRVCPKGDNGGWVFVVGRHTETGALVSSSLPVTDRGLINSGIVRSRPVQEAAGALEIWEKRATDAAREAGKQRDEVKDKLDDGERGPYCQSAAGRDQLAADADAKAEAAESEVERLQHLADAAKHRAVAAKARAEAEAASAKADELDGLAATAAGHAETCRAALAERSQAYDEHRTRVLAVAVEWQALPLIVLAGLR